MTRISTATLVLFLILPRGADAQRAWDAPSMMRPAAPAGLSILLTEADPGDGLGGLVIWRARNAPAGLGFRAGLAEFGDDVSFQFGLDVSGPLARFEVAGDPRLMWWAGAGAGIEDDLLLSFPAGLVLGWEIAEENARLMPYIGGHLALDAATGGEDELDLEGVFDIGLDLGLGNDVTVRFGASLGGREALGVGVAFPVR